MGEFLASATILVVTAVFAVVYENRWQLKYVENPPIPSIATKTVLIVGAAALGALTAIDLAWGTGTFAPLLIALTLCIGGFLLVLPLYVIWGFQSFSQRQRSATK